jgi:23S rRNA pseudouridine1911/1915/1917 synthase
MIFKIEKENDGREILSFLKSALKISASALSALKRDEQGILVNGKHATVRYVLRENDILSINENDSEKDANEAIVPSPLPLDILFENNDIIVASKPPYMPTHPSHNHYEDTLANAIAYKYKQENKPFVFRPIGRLDRNTSGVSLIAKSSISASFLYYARQKDLIKKKYIAILSGCIKDDGEIHTIDTYMKRQKDSVIVRCVTDANEEGAFRAITHYRVLFASDKATVVEAIPETGRTHQLRVHFAYIGHHILGDDIYGEESESISRHALHAFYLSIPMPYTTDIKEFISPPPDDMRKALNDICEADLDDIYIKIFKKGI